MSGGVVAAAVPSLEVGVGGPNGFAASRAAVARLRWSASAKSRCARTRRDAPLVDARPGVRTSLLSILAGLCLAGYTCEGSVGYVCP